MGKLSQRVFVGDFETTVYEGQTTTEVWASACVEIGSEDVIIFKSIHDQFLYFKSLDSNIICYYHNLKFDGTFWLSYLMVDLGMEQAYTKLNEEGTSCEFLTNKDMPDNSFKYMISEMGQWYTITIKVNNKIIELRDSLKLLPFSVKRIGDSFATKHKKLNMVYEGYRYSGCEITKEEREYIANDVLVVKEALEIMFNEGHNRLTIGSCCLAEFKKTHDKIEYEQMFPNLYEIEIDKDLYGSPNAGEYILKSYKGGWCYLVKGKKCKKYSGKGTTADVNSLYPSMMSSESGNYYPVGKPTFWSGDYIPEEALSSCFGSFSNHRYFFVRVKTRFYLKEGYLPFIQLKGNYHYKGTECLETSDVYNKETGEYQNKYIGLDGTIKDTRVTLTLTMTDYFLLKEHYHLVDFEILDGCWFGAEIGIFDQYIDKYAKLKKESKNARRELAKLFLNNLYGKMASSTNSSFKLAYTRDDDSVGFIPILEYNKKPGYIPVGSAITSYARNFTIRAAQINYHGDDERGFIYADTDSIHCDLEPDEIKGITVHPVNFCCWKLETCWDEAYFTRQKTYIEHVTHEDLHEVESPYYNIKCAGMPDKCKKLFLKSMEGYEPSEDDDYTQEELDFLKTKRTIDDFKEGLIVPGKLMPKRIKGGTLLVSTSYEMR